MIDSLITAYPLILSLLVTGAIAGILAGLLGVGGGIIIVPVLFTVLGTLDVPMDVRLHVAIGTSLATIVPTSLASVRAHHRKGAVDWPLFKTWAPGLVIGVVLGTILATRLFSGTILALVFAVVALCVALDIAFRDRSMPQYGDGNTLSELWIYKSTASVVSTMVGAFSALMGIGGGTLSVPILNAARYPMHRAVATSAAFGLIISIPAAAGYIIGGWGLAGLPFGSIGYVNMLGLAVITATTVLTAPFGSRLAHALTEKSLRFLFSGFLVLTAIRMAYAAVSG
ncbi:MAG: sulfite exporter TauE/SafE family protein [Rhodospirillaceae bacterium]